ncbi:MAG: hypothetical protein LBI45_02170 [Bacteroidales bacterium]|jgi:hypothetical protein|nr:hypothetical protein [Bacteroidales bacterium]
MNINFERLLHLLLPTFLRKDVIKSFLSAASVALQENKNNVDDYFTSINYHLRVTPQTFSLEKMLNDKCDKTLRRIYVGAPEPEPPFYFLENGKIEMQYFSNNNYFMGNSVYAYDFIVFVPLILKSENTTNFITAMLNKYKLITKSFNIQYL